MIQNYTNVLVEEERVKRKNLRVREREAMKIKSNIRYLVVDLFRQGDTVMEMRGTRLKRLKQSALRKASREKTTDIRDLSLFIGSILFVVMLVVVDLINDIGGLEL